jgi:hypothetical protein
VHAEDNRTVGWAFVDVVDAERAIVPVRNLGVPGLIRKAGKVAEAIVGGAEYLHR